MNGTEPSMTVTEDLIKAGESAAGGWNRHQLELIGEAWPPVKGWKWRAQGRMISIMDAERFIDMKGLNKTERKKVGQAMGQMRLLHVQWADAVARGW